jgi:hypothetical protein
MSHDRACVGMSDVRRNQEDISGGGEKGTNHVHTWAIYAMALDYQYGWRPLVDRAKLAEGDST